ncbi:MAG: DUF5801 repeats-in-toxin domain-containing protein [Pseudomonadota bacterium]
MPTPVLAIDETSGLQTSGAGLTVDDVLPSTLPDRFKTNLSAAGAPFASAIGAAASPGQVATFAANTTDVAFTNASGAALSAVASNLLTLDGTMIYLYTSTTDNNVVYGRKGTDTDGLGPNAPSANANGAIVFALFLDTGVATGPNDAGATGAYLWMAQFQPIRHPDGTDFNDVVYLQNVLYITANTAVEFSLAGAPSGQNLFLMFGDGSPADGDAAIIVTGRNPNGGDTVNTGQGGGSTTLGTNNQMIDPGEGMYFTFVTLSTNSEGVTVPNLDQNEADLASNIVFDDYLPATSASFALVQLQPPKQTALRITAIDNAVNEQQQAFINGLPAAAGELVNISSVRVERTAKDGSVSTAFNGASAESSVTQNGVTVNFAGSTVVISGLVQNDRVFYTTSGEHNRVLVEHTGSGGSRASFDIGDFRIESTSTSSTLVDPVAILDDGLGVSINTLPGTVDEDGLTGGIAGGTGDVAGTATTASGNVSTLFTAGVDVSLTYTLATDTSGLPALSSGGDAVSYLVTTAAGVDTLTASADGNTVFTFALTVSTGAYTFTLSRPLDHAAGNDENDITIDLSPLVQASDADTDTVTAAASALVITLDDDTPTASTTQGTGTVDEDGLTGGIAGGTGDVAGESVTATGSVTPLFNAGADGIASYGLSTTTTGLPTLTSGAAAVSYLVTSAAGVDTLTASAGGDTVFTFALTASTGAYTFTLSKPLDHAAGNDENDITIDLSSLLNATDNDGDSVPAAASALIITADDDTPAATLAQLSETVDEDGLAGGIESGTGDVAGVAVAASGNVATLFGAGADGLDTYSLSTTTTSLPSLSSGGTAITYAVASAAGVHTLTASAGATPVFTFALTASTGAYTFTLLQPLDHPTLNDLTGDNTENDISIDLSSILRIADKDGDTASAAANALVMVVDDDTPIAFTPDSIALTNTGTAQGTEDLNAAGTVGADGLGSVVFIDQVPADNYLRDTDGNILQSDGENVVLSGYGTGTLTGKTETGNATVFTVALDTTADEYTVTFSREFDDGGGINFLGAAPVRSGNPTYNLINDVDGTPLDLLFSGGDVSDGLPSAHSVNVSTQGAGTDNQSMNPGELLRIDFMSGASLAGSPSGSDFNLGTHQTDAGSRALLSARYQASS